MSCGDKNLSDDMVKLVSYSIVSIKRGHERVVDGACNLCEVFSDNMTPEAFASWVIAKHCDHIPNPDKKYLRVSFCVEGRWEKQDLQYEEKQLHVLHGIENAIRHCCEDDDGKGKLVRGGKKD